MNNDVMPPTVSIWAGRNLPARLDVAATAKLLGFGELDIQILMGTGKLTPLGDPAPNAPKWFSSVAIIRLAIDEDWLHKATRDLAKYWKNKRERAGRKRGRQMASVVPGMVPGGANSPAELN